MQDITVIAKQNAKAVETHALANRDTKKFGLGKYTGLNFHSWADFDTAADRNKAAAVWTHASPGNRTALHNPTH